jgi:mannan endo-1,6-alpha-mannosidase
MFGTLIDYWYYTGDAQYNNYTMQAMQHQVGQDDDFMPLNQTRTEGNDDQGFWAMSSMSAAENNFPNPPSDEPQWLALTQAVFNEYVSRWDTQYCGGGMRWQILSFMSGWDYKNSISNGCFFNIAARLGRYTGNSTYSDWASKIFDWEMQAGLITADYKIYDGVSIPTTVGQNCTNIDTDQWSYNAGVYLHGAAVMYNITESSTWKTRVDGLLNMTVSTFTTDGGVLYEKDCEQQKQCDLNEQSFKGFCARSMTAASKMAPYIWDTVSPVLQASAQAAVSVCTGTSSSFPGTQGQACGFSWLTKSTFDGSTGVGQQMNALDSVMYLLAPSVGAPVTDNSGGTSTGNAAAGNTNPDKTAQESEGLTTITTADRVGAAFVTILMISGLGGLCTFLFLGETI